MDQSLENVKCPDCGGDMVSRKGQYGIFWGCKAFPKCKGTRDSNGRSKADREEYKRQKAEEKGEVYDSELGNYQEPLDNRFSFNRKK